MSVDGSFGKKRAHLGGSTLAGILQRVDDDLRVTSTDFVGEFDPGSGRTLAACLTHASRAVRPLWGYTSGERVSNTWVTCPLLWDKPGKLGLILDMTSCCMVWGGKLCSFWGVVWWGMGP